MLVVDGESFEMDLQFIWYTTMTCVNTQLP